MERLVEVLLSFWVLKELGSLTVIGGSLANIANCNNALPVFIILFR